MSQHQSAQGPDFLDDGRLSVEALVLPLTLNLSRHLKQYFDLATDTQCVWSAWKEALQMSEQLAPFQHRLEGCSVSISRSELVHSGAQNAWQGLQSAVLEIDLMEPLLQSHTALV